MFPQIPQRSSTTQRALPPLLTKAMPTDDSQGRLSVLQVATLNQPIKAGLGYGPIESVIYNLDKGLHAAGYRSVVACSADSRVTGEHCVTSGNATGNYCVNSTPKRRQAALRHLELALERANRGDIDLIHLHDADAVDYFDKHMTHRRLPMVLTLHVAAEESGLGRTSRRWTSSTSVTCAAISEHQRRKYQHLLKVGQVVHHGIDLGNTSADEPAEAGRYLFTIGRITRGKGQDQAIELAKRTGKKLIIAGCVQNKAEDQNYFASIRKSIDLKTRVDHFPPDQNYYKQVIEPLLLSDKQVIYIGELRGEYKAQWYRHALATVFPVRWDEPFGLVLIESMSFGTPVIANDRGAVPELVVQGRTGFIVDSMSAMIGAVGWVDSMDRAACRSHVEKHFSIARMTDGYSGLYRRILQAECLRGETWPLQHEPSTVPLFTLPV